MNWEKISSSLGDFWTFSSTKDIIHYIKNISIEELNDSKRSFEFARNSNFVYEQLQIDQKTDGNELPSGLYQLRVPDRWSPPKLYELKIQQDKNLFELEVVKEVIEHFNTFKDSKTKYLEKGYVYKRGALLYGPPGTGKSTAINMIINQLTLDEDSLVIFIYNAMPRTLVDVLKKDPRLKIFIFEELTQVLNSSAWSIADFLCFLDGEGSCNNSYILATTNYPEDLPGNIVDRPGRFDTLIYLGNLSDKDRLTFMTKTMGHRPTDEELEITKELSIAAIKELLLLSNTKSITLKEANTYILEHKRVVKNHFKEGVKKVGFSDYGNDD